MGNVHMIADHGPWHVQGIDFQKGGLRIGPDHQAVAVELHNDVNTACLLAAAPELRDALKAIMRMIAGLDLTEDQRRKTSPAWEIAVMALSKALTSPNEED